jgi:hypothetical protein
MTEQWDRTKLEQLVIEWWQDETPKVMAMVDGWLKRGDGAAIYRNSDLGHRDVGLPRIVSYGSPTAQLEVTDPPTTLPDGIPAGAINYRFQLEAVCGGPYSG